jgi:aryl-alcohol dehydrogenase-like predicted oxidoreductase
MQYSPVDRRCEAVMVPLCRARGIKIYTYGSLLGGFLSEVWLDKPAPQLHEVQNRSLVKYGLIIDDWGGWDRYQGLLRQLKAVATRPVCSIPQVVIAALLGCAGIDAVIVGLSATNYKRQNCELARKVTLSDDELRALWSWECPLAGGVYHLERTSSKTRRDHAVQPESPGRRRGRAWGVLMCPQHTTAAC